jgi:hypothetical protein
MFGSGKKQDFIITVLPRYSYAQPSPFGGGEETVYNYDRLQVYAEHGYKELFKKIDGVFECREDDPTPMYIVFCDPRYDVQWIIKEIEAVIKIGEKSRRSKSISVEPGGFLMPTFSWSSTTNPEPKNKRSRKTKKDDSE